MRLRTEPVIRGVALIVLVPLLASCDEGVLGPRGPVGQAELTILYDATAIMLAVIVPVILLTLAFAWWFRAGTTRARYLPDWKYSGKVEMIVWSIPALVIVFLGGIAWIASRDLDPSRVIESAAVPLDVVSLDWKWLFIYPNEGIASVNRLVVPVGTPVRFHLTSASVMNSCFVPQLGSQIYTMPGITTRLSLKTDQIGVHKGFSAQFSGDGFSDMHFDVAPVPAAQFAAWVDTAKTQEQTLDVAAHADLARPSKALPSMTYASVTPGLFETTSAGQPDADADGPVDTDATVESDPSSAAPKCRFHEHSLL